MTQFFGSRLGLSVLLAVFAISVATSNALAQGDGQAPPPKGETTPSAPSDGKTYELKYKLAIGDVLRYEVTHRASIQSTIEQTTQAAQTKTDSVKNWKVTDVLPTGEIEFMNVVERVAMVNQLPERDPIEYDSDRDKIAPPGFEDAAKAVGVPLSVIRITPQGRVTNRDIRLRQLQVEEDAPIVVRLPERPVAIGDTWDEPFDIKLELQGGATKAVQTRRHHKLTAVNGDLATIEVTYQVLSPVDAAQEAQLVQRMMSGNVQFNIATGRVVSQQMDIDKRILGFAGAASSMQYVMRMEEKLLVPQKKVAVQPPPDSQPQIAKLPPGAPAPPGTKVKEKTPDITPVKDTAENAPPPPDASQAQPRPTRTANRPRPTGQKARGSIR